MTKPKILFYDTNKTPIFEHDLVEINGQIYKVLKVGKDFMFYKDGAGWRFNNKEKIRKIFK